MQPWMYGIESPGEKDIFSRSRALFSHIFEITTAVKLRKEIIGEVTEIMGDAIHEASEFGFMADAMAVHNDLYEGHILKGCRFVSV